MIRVRKYPGSRNVKYHPGPTLVLTLIPVNPGREQFQLGSLTGAVSSKRVTEEFKGTLSLVGNQASSAKVEGCLTARLISRADTKVGFSDPVVSEWKGHRSSDKRYSGDNRLIASERP